MIDVRGLRKSFGHVEAVRGVTFQASAGQVVGLLGPNGAGKTTTIRMITGYLPPSAGSVSVEGLDSVADSRAVRSRIGYLPESAPLYPEMRVEDYLDHRGRLHGLERAARRAATGRVVERCQLKEARRRRIGELSKGYRQRVGLAATLLHDPPVLILDEPTTGLDPSQIVEARRLIRDLAREKTMIFSSHILPEVEVTCDRLVIMARGRVRAAGAIHELVQPLRDAARYVIEARPATFGAPRASAARDLVGAVAGAFEQTDGVAATNGERADDARGADAGWVRVAVTPWPDAPDLRERLAHTAETSGLIVRELRRDTPSLEQLFIRLVHGADEEELAEEGAA